MYVEEVVIHPEFHHYQHDLALLRLPRPLPHLPPLCLPPETQGTGDSFIGMRSDYLMRSNSNITSRCVATGWGQTTKDGALEDRLHQAVLRVQNNTDCGQVASCYHHQHCQHCLYCTVKIVCTVVQLLFFPQVYCY